jgi:hypothetical protein
VYAAEAQVALNVRCLQHKLKLLQIAKAGREAGRKAFWRAAW